ncbi:MAG: ATP phosphoribosyltransferase regulatory subunit [Rhodocyclaceae bacterium]|nr:MAG: ATP phosphoribosyltransferase regulatory subunit [Rhodocyclaceae bacterium]
MKWRLPEHLADVLPPDAARIEGLRRRLLDLFWVRGYDLVMPPLLEHLDSLLTGSGQDLKLRTFKLVDQLSGRTLGIRADMTPQVARIDAHLLNRDGVTRLCYCDSVLHTLPASLAASREPIQLGAELFGYAGLAADREVIRLMADALQAAGAAPARIDLGHVGVFRALSAAAGVDDESEALLLQLLQAKDVTALREQCSRLEEPFAAAFLALPGLYGGAEVPHRAAGILPDLPQIGVALQALIALQTMLPDLPLSFDLADLRGYHYHNGVVFAAYRPAFSSAVALGGRYDGVGSAFGRTRAATGFSLDLRELTRLAEPEAPRPAILAPYSAGKGGLEEAISALRKRGERVVEQLPGEVMDEEGRPGDRQLVERDGQWVIEAIRGGV